MATRPGDWGALGLDGDPTPGDAAAITTIADAMRDLATHAGTINQGLKALQQTAGDGQRFIGKTADQLRDMVDDHLHNFVGHVEESFHQAEAALRTYATAVTNAQADADAALTAIQGLADDDPQRQTHIDRADEAKSALGSAASTLDKALTSAGSLMVQPVSDCDLFWEAFEWLTIILSVIAIFTGGVLAVLAWGMNAVLLIKTIVDFSQGKASGLELGLAFLGVLFPTTKALPVGSIIKGLGSALKGGFQGIAGAGKNILAEIGHFSSLHGIPKVVVAPIVLGIHAAPAFNVVNGLKGLGNLGKGGWESLVKTVAKDWADVTKGVSGDWGKIGAYAKANFERLGRAGIATVLPLDFTEMGVLGFGGAARLAFAERVLGIPQNDLRELLANAGRTDAAVRNGTFGIGALAPFRPVGGSGVHFAPGGFVDLSALHLVPGGFHGTSFPPVHIPSVSPGGLTKFPGAVVPNGIGGVSLDGLGAFRPAGLGTFTISFPGNLVPNGLGSFGHGALNLNLPGNLGNLGNVGNLGNLGIKGLGPIPHTGVNVPHGISTPNTVSTPKGIGAPHGITVPTGSFTPTGVHFDQPALVTTTPHLPGTTTLDNGLTVPDVHGAGATRLIQQTDFAAGNVRLDSNLLLSADTAIDLLKDTHVSSPLSHAGTEVTNVRVPEVSFDSGFVHGIGDGHSMARGAIGHGEALEDMTFPELTALANGDVSVTSFHADGISFRIGEAPPRTITAEHLANTVPGGPVRTDLTGLQDAAATRVPAGAQHLPGTQGLPGAPGVAETIRPTGAGAHVETAGLQGAVPPPRDLAKGVADLPATNSIPGPLRATTPDAVPHTKTSAAPGAGATAKAAPQPAVDEHDLAMSLLDTGDRKPVPATGHSATVDSGPSGVSARPDLDGAGASGAADHSALDLIAHPGGGLSKAEDAAAVPVALKATEHTPTPTPTPPPAPKTGAVPTPEAGAKAAGPVTAPPGSRFGGFSGVAAMNQRLRARDDLILGGSTGPEAGAKLNAWAGYEHALSQLGKAERKVDELTPPPGAAPAEPPPALAEALDELGVKRAEVAKAEVRLDELGIDAQRTRKQINALTGGIFGEHGLGGGPLPHPQPQAVPTADIGKGTADIAEPGPVPHVDKGKGKADFTDPAPVPHVDKGKGKADFAEPEPVPVTPVPVRPGPEERLGHGPGSGIGGRARANDEIITGGTAGPQAELRLSAWEQYQRASHDLARAQDKVDGLVPKTGQPGPSELSATARGALDDLSAREAEMAGAEARLDELGMDPNAIQRQIDDAKHAIAIDRAQRGEYVGALGGAPAPHSDVPAPHLDEPLPLGQHDWSPDPQAPHALWPEPGTHGAGRTMVNRPFRDLPYAGHHPLTAGDYLKWMRESTGEGRPLSFVVNTIAPYSEIATPGRLQDFLNSVTRGLDGYDGRLGVVIGVNGKAEDLAAIHRAMDQALGSVHFDHPLALVATTFYGETFPYGTVRNHTMTSPAARSMAHSMMHGGGAGGPSHPYWAFMDFDVYEHTVPSGRHIFDHFDRELNLGAGGAVDDWAKKLPEDTGAGGKAADDPAAVADVPDTPPLRPLVMTGGYRVPAKTGETVIVDGVEVDRSAVDLIQATKTRDDTPEGMVFTQQLVDKFASVVDSDMRIRAKMAGFHGLLPYGPEPNLFVDAAITMLDDVRLAEGVWRPVRFGGGTGEYKGLRERLNYFNAWELDQTLPDLPGNTVAREIAAANSVLPDRGTAFLADFVDGAVPTDLSRLMSGYYKHGKAGGVGNMPQEHLTPKNVVEHVFARDTFDLEPSLSRAKDDTKFKEIREDLAKGKSPEQAFKDDPLKPIGIDGRRPEFNEHPRATVERLGAGLGADHNTLGLNISIRVPGKPDGLVVGIVPADKRFISHAVATAPEELAYKRLQNYVIAEVLPQGGLPHDSLLRALPEPPVGGSGPKGPGMKPGTILDAPALLTQVQRQMGKNGVENMINDAYAQGIDGRALAVGLLSGRLGPDVSDLGPIEQIMLDRYATALNRPLEIRGADGTTHTVDIKTRRPGRPLYVTWVPDHGGPQPGHWEVGDDVPAPPPDKGNGAPGGSGTKGPGSTTPPPAPDRLGHTPGSGIGDRAAVRHDIVTGGTSGPQAELRLGAWERYERASFDLAKAQDRADGLVPEAGQPGPSKPSAAALEALDELRAKRAEFADAEARLGELGMDPHAIRQQIDDANTAIAVDRAQRGEYVGPLGGAPSPRAGGPSGSHDVEMADAAPGASAPGGNHTMPAGLQWDRDLSRGTVTGDIRVNTAFRDLQGHNQRPLSETQYLDNLRQSLDERRPISYIVNAVVKYDEFGPGQLEDFLRAVRTNMPGSFDGRFGVVIGVNGPAAEIGRINAAVRQVLDDVHTDFPLAVVGVGWNGADFPFGAVRNSVMTSPASRSMIHTMMTGGADGTGATHPYIAFMDFDNFEHIVPSGRHIFDFFEKRFEMRGVERAGEPSSAPPLRPLMMTGGYRVPEPPAAGLPDPLLVKTDEHLAKAEAKAAEEALAAGAANKLPDDAGPSSAADPGGAKGKGKGKAKAVAPPRLPGELRVTPDDRKVFVNRIDADTLARVGIAGLHDLLPYAPEPNLFVDASATLVDTAPVKNWTPLRFGPRGAEFHQMSRALNTFNAWELDTTLPRLTEADFPRLEGESRDDWLKRVEDGITDRDAQRAIAAGNHTLPDRGAAFVTEYVRAAIPTDLSRIMAKFFGKEKKLLQDHAGLSQLERLVENKDAKSGLELADVRDHRFKLSPQAADDINPFRPVLGPDQETPREVAARLSDAMGSDANPLGPQVSAPLPSEPTVRAGINPQDIRFITHAYAHNSQASRFLNHLDHAIVYPSHQPPPTSVFHAFEHAPGRLGLPSPQELLRGVRDQLEFRGNTRTRIDAAINEAIARGTTGQELYIALTTGRLRTANFLPDGLAGPVGGPARHTAEDLALQRFTNALGRELHITFADGSMATFAPDNLPKRVKRLPPPVEIVWTASPDTTRYPDGGYWSIADPDGAPAAGGKRGHDSADGPGGDTGHHKRPRKGKGRAAPPADQDTPMGDAR
ncbi:putative T7SS-secreted protein [Streptomyces sp. NPDC018019]|uniref:putative T7SS-secreted protein n=1 Tax=Streptomyces sp. NPDC018019 TaxID=3365030 RepID=UPI0037B4E151